MAARKAVRRVVGRRPGPQGAAGLRAARRLAGRNARRPSSPAASRPPKRRSAASASPSRSMATTQAAERIIPFDIMPRVFSAGEWAGLSAGLEQRVRAINLFIDDVYGARRILADGVVPADIILANPQYCIPVAGARPPHGVYAHICGIDLVRTGAGRILCARGQCPHAVGRLLHDRKSRGDAAALPGIVRRFAGPAGRFLSRIAARDPAVGRAARRPRRRLRAAHPRPLSIRPSTNTASWPTIWGSSWSRAATWRSTTTWSGCGRSTAGSGSTSSTGGSTTPFSTRSSSAPIRALGVPGLMAAYLAGNVALVNAPGTGIADDKAVYSYMPEIVRYYTGEEPRLPNVETWRCREPEALSHVLANLEKMVVKLVDGSGGYGMLVGPTASKKEIENFRAALKAEPRPLYRPADPRFVDRADPDRPGPGAAPRRFPAVRADRRQRHHHRPRRTHPGCAARRIAGGEFEPGRRHQGQPGACRSRPRPGGTPEMLSRTAANLYWIGRYMERAEFTCRLVEATIRLSALSDHAEGDQAWMSALSVAGAAQAFEATGETFSVLAAQRYLTLSEDNRSSIRSCLAGARDNARAARTALTVEVWEAINRAWLVIRDRTRPGSVQADAQSGRQPEGRDSRLRRRAGADAAQRGLLVRQSRLADRARRQHGAAARRQILSAAAAGPGGGRRARPRPVEHAAADRLGADRLPPYLRRRAPALAGRRLPDLPLRNAALARRFRRGDRDLLVGLRRAHRAAGPGRPAGAPAARPDGEPRRSATSSSTGCTNGSSAYIARKCGARPGDRQPVPVRLMRLTVHHSSDYSYRSPARRVTQLLKVTPSSFAGQAVLDWRIDVDQDARLREGRDGYGNVTHMLYVDSPVDAASRSRCRAGADRGRAGVVQGLSHDLPPRNLPARRRRSPAAAPPSPTLPTSSPRPGGDRSTGCTACAGGSTTISASTPRRPRSRPPPSRPPPGHGVCQDFAHIFIAAARAAGIPARYISGHLFRRDGAHRPGGGPCLGRGLGRGSRLGRLRSAQRHQHRRRLCPRRLRPRLSRRRADRRRTIGWRRRGTDGTGAGQRKAGQAQASRSARMQAEDWGG